MHQKILILAYPGSGKTFVANNYADTFDFEVLHYHYDYGKYKHLLIDQLKGHSEIRTNNSDWPNNFFKALNIALEKSRIVLTFYTYLTEILDYLETLENTRIIFVIQKKDKFEKLAEIFRNRGNGEEFIERRKNDFQKYHEVIANSKFKKIYLNENEFVYDALIKAGIKLKKGKGIKNYI